MFKICVCVSLERTFWWKRQNNHFSTWIWIVSWMNPAFLELKNWKNVWGTIEEIWVRIRGSVVASRAHTRKALGWGRMAAQQAWALVKRYPSRAGVCGGRRWSPFWEMEQTRQQDNGRQVPCFWRKEGPANTKEERPKVNPGVLDWNWKCCHECVVFSVNVNVHSNSLNTQALSTERSGSSGTPVAMRTPGTQISVQNSISH